MNLVLFIFIWPLFPVYLDVFTLAPFSTRQDYLRHSELHIHCYAEQLLLDKDIKPKKAFVELE